MPKTSTDNLGKSDNEQIDAATSTNIKDPEAAMEMFADQMANLLWRQWMYMKNSERNQELELRKKINT